VTSASELLIRCRALGVDLAAGPDGALSWEADSDPPDGLLADLRRLKPQLLLLLRPQALSPSVRPAIPSKPSAAAPDPSVLAALQAPPRCCPECRGSLDQKARCWKCCERLCGRCGRATGSAFLQHCLVCDGAFRGQATDVDAGEQSWP
jgi:hypothetical protein